jgi:hypothetical protein
MPKGHYVQSKSERREGRREGGRKSLRSPSPTYEGVTYMPQAICAKLE